MKYVSCVALKLDYLIGLPQSLKANGAIDSFSENERTKRYDLKTLEQVHALLLTCLTILVRRVQKPGNEASEASCN